MIAREQVPDTSSNPATRRITIKFRAHVRTSCGAHTLNLNRTVMWDVHRTAGEVTVADVENIAGHGTKYHLGGYPGVYYIKGLLGLNIDLQIASQDDYEGIDDTDWDSWIGTDSSVELIKPGTSVYTMLSYKSSNETDFYKDTVIYVPIPKKGVDYAKHFENLVLTNPGLAENPDTATFGFTANLDGPVTLHGINPVTPEHDTETYTQWITYYAIEDMPESNPKNSEVHEETDEEGNPITVDTWEPVVDSETGDYLNWKLEKDMSASDWAKVKMLKFVAQENIRKDGYAQCVIKLNIPKVDVDGAQIQSGMTDYWRGFGKPVAFNDGSKSGNWEYTSVVAMTPAAETMRGLIFIDVDQDGVYTENTDVIYTPKDASKRIGATIMRGNVNISPTYTNGTAAVGDNAGNVRVLNGDKDLYLQEGEHTVMVFDNDPDYELLTTVAGTTTTTVDEESGTLKSINWANDLSGNNFSFTVENVDQIVHYFGIALKPVVQAQIPVKKELTGRAWKDSDSFTFNIAAPAATGGDSTVAPAAPPLPDRKTAIVTSSTANKTAKFDAITYDTPGTYTYELTETIPANARDLYGDGGKVMNGVSYDQSKKTVTVKVEKSVDGKTLTATVEPGDQAPTTFTNVYRPEPVKAALDALKIY
ncbi:MAG: hypothetical protein IIZ47_02015, partial [Erysipelotrichaceae bacterium]|nr:hypothetical protein [Erysipelotrichaceae bacterium]